MVFIKCISLNTLRGRVHLLLIDLNYLDIIAGRVFPLHSSNTELTFYQPKYLTEGLVT